jgi:hypothetical protein
MFIYHSQKAHFIQAINSANKKAGEFFSRHLASLQLVAENSHDIVASHSLYQVVENANTWQEAFHEVLINFERWMPRKVWRTELFPGSMAGMV